MDLMAGMAAAKAAVTLAQTLRDLEKNIDSASYRSIIADLMNASSDARIALADAKDALAERDREIERLKASFEVKAATERGAGDYLYRTENGFKVGYPYCPKCDHVDGRMMQLVRDGHIESTKCPACGTTYNPVTAYCIPEPGEPDTAYQRQLKRQNEGMDRLSRSARSKSWMG